MWLARELVSHIYQITCGVLRLAEKKTLFREQVIVSLLDGMEIEWERKRRLGWF